MQPNKSIRFKDYLKNELNRRINLNSAYSMRAFARDLKISVSRLSEFLSDRAGISYNRIDQIIHHLKLPVSEEQFVRDIAAIEFSPLEDEKNKALERISDSHKNIVNMTAEEFTQISNWYYFAIMVLISKMDIPSDYTILENKIGVHQNKCTEAIDRLIKAELIFEQDGFWKATHNRILVVGEQKKSIQKFHKQFMIQSAKSFCNSSFEEREFSSTFAMLNEEEIQMMRKKIRDTVEATFNQINEKRKYSNDDLDLKLYGLGIQFFPIKPSNESIPEEIL